MFASHHYVGEKVMRHLHDKAAQSDAADDAPGGSRERRKQMEDAGQQTLFRAAELAVIDPNAGETLWLPAAWWNPSEECWWFDDAHPESRTLTGLAFRPGRGASADLVQRRFGPPTPDRLWVAGLTYVSTWSGFGYVAFVVDADARWILGWRVAPTMATAMVLDAIEQAIWIRQQATRRCSRFERCCPPYGPGIKYTSIRFTERLAEAGIQPSVAAVGSSYDNALAETINGLYKTELAKPRKPWRTIEEVELATAEWATGSTTAGSINSAQISHRSIWRRPTTLTTTDQPPAEFSHQEVSRLIGRVIASQSRILIVGGQ